MNTILGMIQSYCAITRLAVPLATLLMRIDSG